jgi:hypothetical protein
LLEAGFFDEKHEVLEPKDNNLVVLESNISFKFPGKTSGDGSTLLEHARKRRHEEDLAAAQALEPEPRPAPEPEPPEAIPAWSDELRGVFHNE